MPQPTDNLDDSQVDLLGNFQQLDTSFGIDHYKFSDLTANNGFHNKVTTPAFVDSPPSGLPPVTVANPVFYSFQDSANVGVIQYSRGPNNAVPSPITYLQSTSAAITLAPNATTNVLDFTGLARAFCLLIAGDSNTPTTNKVLAYVFWNGATVTTGNSATGSNFLIPQASGNILQLKNTNAGALTGVYWTLELLRLS